MSVHETAEASVEQLQISAEREPHDPPSRGRRSPASAGVVGAAAPEGQVVYRLHFALGDEAGEARVHIPSGRIPVVGLVPALQFLADTVVYAAQRVAEQQGKTITCGPGCTACCCQAVPIGEAEALYLAMVAGSMAPDAQAKCRARFAQSVATLREAGLLGRARGIVAAGGNEGAEHELAVNYFGLRVPCPFLDEAGSCGIYAHRPLRCREHLVTSPPERCLDPELRATATVPGLVRVSPLLYRFGDGMGADAIRCLLLVEALEWADAHRDVPPATFPGPLLFENFLRALLGAPLAP